MGERPAGSDKAPDNGCLLLLPHNEISTTSFGCVWISATRIETDLELKEAAIPNLHGPGNGQRTGKKSLPGQAFTPLAYALKNTAGQEAYFYIMQKHMFVKN